MKHTHTDSNTHTHTHTLQIADFRCIFSYFKKGQQCKVKWGVLHSQQYYPTFKQSNILVKNLCV